MSVLNPEADYSQFKKDLIFVVIALFGMGVAFGAGIAYEQNSMPYYWLPEETDHRDCYRQADYLNAYTYLVDLTDDLKQKDCNEINWLYKKVRKARGLD